MNAGGQRIKVKGRRVGKRQRCLLKTLNCCFQLGRCLCLASGAPRLISLVMASLVTCLLALGAAFSKTTLIFGLQFLSHGGGGNFFLAQFRLIGFCLAGFQ